MISWALRRRVAYLSALVVALSLLLILPAFVTFYETPSCFDGKKNQGERGVDCGGPCVLLCRSDALPPVVLWSQKFEVDDNRWSVVAHVENPNFDSGAFGTPYTFKMFDANGMLLLERSGRTDIPPRKRFYVFEGSVITKNPIAALTFDFSEPPRWQKMSAEGPEITFINRDLTSAETRPRLSAVLRNQSVLTLKNVPIATVVYDTGGNAIGVSRTVVDSVAPNSDVAVVFTWPKPFPTDTSVCDSPADIAVLIDRSGSMDDSLANPPQPMTDVKTSAAAFIDFLQGADQSSVVSFATAASNPIEATLTDDKAALKTIIEGITIRDDGTQYTNISDALSSAVNELFSGRHRENSKRVIVVLTDGIANYPKSDADAIFGERIALSFASEAKSRDVLIYTIGLGSGVNETFLRSLATKPENYYAAPTTATLSSVYKEIATSICRKSNTARIDFSPIIMPGVNY